MLEGATQICSKGFLFCAVSNWFCVFLIPVCCSKDLLRILCVHSLISIYCRWKLGDIRLDLYSTFWLQIVKAFRDQSVLRGLYLCGYLIWYYQPYTHAHNTCAFPHATVHTATYQADQVLGALVLLVSGSRALSSGYRILGNNNTHTHTYTIRIVHTSGQTGTQYTTWQGRTYKIKRCIMHVPGSYMRTCLSLSPSLQRRVLSS